MVRLFNMGSVDNITRLVSLGFSIQQHFTHIVEVGQQNIQPCIYAMWHAHQCCIYGLPKHEQTYVMVSRSKDGEVVARAIHDVFGFELVRGSKGRMGAVEASKQMVERLKEGKFGAIMVDGPRGPEHVVKEGIIKIAKLSGAPIVPVTWYSPNFNLYKLPSWDRLEMPIGDVRLINLYGEPISVPEDAEDELLEIKRLELQESLLELDRRAPEEYEKIYRFGLWRRKQ